MPTCGEPYNKLYINGTGHGLSATAADTAQLSDPLPLADVILMSSLIPERPLVISPLLATTIGLEEAVLLQILNDVSTFKSPQQRGSYAWFSLPLEQLQVLTPFWDQQSLQKISARLRDLGIILLDTATDPFSFAMNEAPASDTATAKHRPLTTPARTFTAPKPQAAQQPFNSQPHAIKPNNVGAPIAARRGTSPGASLMTSDWQASEDLLQLLTLNHNIPRDFADSQREDFVLYWLERQQVSHSWSSKFRQHVLKEWRFHQSRQAQSPPQQNASKDINGQWAPSLDAMEILQRAGISGDFIEDAVAEFVLYWRERGEAHSTWNSKFIHHIRRQWAKFTQAMELDYEPRQIAANWQPNEDVYDILRLAKIELAFARQLVPEFVLFWRDTQEIQRSWNTKFLQHCKYQWATRHQMEVAHARQSKDHQPGQAKDGSLIKRLTDRSWAKGIVEGI